MAVILIPELAKNLIVSFRASAFLACDFAAWDKRGLLGSEMFLLCDPHTLLVKIGFPLFVFAINIFYIKHITHIKCTIHDTWFSTRYKTTIEKNYL